IGSVFRIASNNMKLLTAGKAWDLALNTGLLNINEEDKNVLMNLSKLLGKTDIQGQVSQIEITESFLDEQITKAEGERIKSEKMYRSLGIIMGLAIVIILL
ncbi:MAG: stage III sporulation protein AB, partial [Oscillospiraceae bacterium]|nr:stage III sporulation protein AB [Oscillospiraceae bacterium]